MNVRMNTHKNSHAMVYLSHQLINRLVLNNVAASTIQPKHVLFAIIRLEFYAINQNRFIGFRKTCNKNDDTNINAHRHNQTHAVCYEVCILYTVHEFR